MSEENQLELIPSPATELHKASQNVASLCREIVVATSVQVQGKNFVQVEGWQSIAAAWGCTPEIAGPPKHLVIDKGGDQVQAVRSEAVLKRDRDGAVLSRAFGLVAMDEYEDGNVDLYAMEAKSQTRAISRVCRNKFAFVVVMMNAGLQTTPAEEVPAQGFKNAKQAKPAPRKEAIESIQGVVQLYGTKTGENGEKIHTCIVTGKYFWTKHDQVGAELAAVSGKNALLKGIPSVKKPNCYHLQAVEIPQPEGPVDDRTDDDIDI